MEKLLEKMECTRSEIDALAPEIDKFLGTKKELEKNPKRHQKNQGFADSARIHGRVFDRAINIGLHLSFF
jgi:hypothetical protein